MRWNWILAGAAIVLSLSYAAVSLAQASSSKPPSDAGSSAVNNHGTGTAVPQDGSETAQLEKLRAELDKYEEGRGIRFIGSRLEPGNPWSAYVHSWVDHIEKVGNLNYPNVARKKQMSGNVIVTTCILKSGALASVNIARSSGNPILDAGALSTVRMAAPFQPLLSSETWVQKLCITRTFGYIHGAPGAGSSSQSTQP